MIGGVWMLNAAAVHAQTTPQKEYAAHAISDQDIDLLRKDLRSKRKQLIAANLKLNEIEATKFWPVYDQYTTELFPFRPEVVGQAAPKVVLGKGSGIDSIKNALAKLGIQASEEDAMKVVATVKEFSLRHKRLLTDAEFREIVDTVLPKAASSEKGARVPA